MLSRFFSLLVLVCVWCLSAHAQSAVPPGRDNFYEELQRNFVPAPAHKPPTRRNTRALAWPELTENNASDWGAFASDGAVTTLTDSTSKVKVGSASLLFTTKSGGDTGVRYPASGEAHLDVASKARFVFWAYGYNTNSYGFQGEQPVVVLRFKGGTLRYTPSSQVMSNDYWRYYSIPLGGSSSWIRTSTGTPDLSDLLSLEIHQDTWDSGFSVTYDGVAFRDAAPTTNPASGLAADVISPRILLYCFDPIMENLGGVRQHQTHGWTDPVLLTQRALADLKRSSHDLYQPQIVETKISDEHPYFVDGFQHTDESFEKTWNVPSDQRDFHQSSIFDYPRFCRENNIVARIESGEIDEVWIYTGPISGTWESTMVGNGAYWLNSSPPPIKSNRLFAIMGLNFERGVGEAIHSFGHRCESILSRNYGGWPQNQSTNWGKFTLLHRNIAGLGGVGNVHFPFNGIKDYDYANTTAVPSNADDWANYPTFLNTTRTFGSQEWSPFWQDPQREYLNWWYSHIPHAAGVNPDGYLNNWWRYIADIDQFKTWDGNLASTEGLPYISIESPKNGAAVSGTVNIQADTFIEGALGRVDFLVDGVVQSSDTMAPYSFAWNTTGLSGVHRLEARAVELSVGNEVVSAPVLVNIGEEPVPTLSISDAKAVEGNDSNSTLSFTVTRSGEPNVAVSVSYATSEGTAKDGSDYTATSGTLTFEPGETERTISVPLVGDLDVEDDETFSIKLSSPTSAFLGVATATGTIQNDDASASIDDVTVSEGSEAGQTQFTVTLSQAVSVPLDVNYATSAGEDSLVNATANEDFTPVSGVLHFEPNQTNATISVPIINDSVFEHDEQFYLDLSGVTTTKSRGIGTIQNDDALPTLSVHAPASTLEGNSGTREVKFTVALSAASKVPATVAYTTVPGESNPASADEDYLPASGTLTFAPGQTEQTVVVTLNGDTAVEANETFALKLSAPTNASIGEGVQATTTIQNDDTSVSVDDVAVSENNEAGKAIFTVTLSPSIPVAVDVTYATAKSSAQNAATPETDFTPTSGTLHFEPNQEKAVVEVPVLNDSIFEADEIFSLNISTDAASGVTVSKTQGIGTIQNDESAPTMTVKVSPSSVLEGNSGRRDATFTVTLPAPAEVPVSATYTTAPGEVNPATPGKDYLAISGTLTFAPGQTEKKLTVSVLGDTETESNETFFLKWSSPQNVSLPTSTPTVTIQNDDTNVSINDVSISEGNANSKATFTITLSSQVPVALDVAYATSSLAEAKTATPGEDYIPTSGTLRFAPNQKSATVTVTTIGDTRLENDELFYLSISASRGSGANVTKARGVATLRNDDTAPTVLIEAPRPVFEGNSGTTPAVFTVKLSKPSGLPVSVPFSVVPGKVNPAIAGQDYVAQAGTLVFVPGQTSKTVSILVRGDILDEADETLTLSLGASVGATVTTNSATALITDDDTGQVSVGAAMVLEGNAGQTLLRFPVSMSLANSRPVVVNYSTGNIAAASPRALAGSDYIAALSTLTIAPGQTRATIDIPILGDMVDEEDERFGLAIRRVTGAAVGVAYAEGVIRDDDAPGRLSISDLSIPEGNRASYATFLVSLSGVSGRTVSVDYATAGATALLGLDFTATKGTLVFLPGETQKRIIVPIVGDLVRENNEAFALKLTNLKNATFVRSAALCTLLNDDK